MTHDEILEQCALDMVLFGTARAKLNADGTIEYISPWDEVEDSDDPRRD